MIFRLNRPAACVVATWLAFQVITPGQQSGPASQRQAGVPDVGGTLVTTNQVLKPVGSRIAFTGNPVDVTASPDGSTIAVSVSNSVALYTPGGALKRRLTMVSAATYAGLAFSPDGQLLAVSNAVGVVVFTLATGVSTAIPIAGATPSGLAFDPVRAKLYVALNQRNQVARIDLDRLELDGAIPTGVAPVGLAITPRGERLFVSNWGGRAPRPGDLVAPYSSISIVVDARGVAATGSVTAVDLDSFSVLSELEVGLHPGGIAIAPDGSIVAVANANSDSVSLIDPVTLAAAGEIRLSAFPESYLGSSPTALAFSPRGARLYVACGGNNTVVALELRSGRYAIAGFAPTDWYPVGLAVTSGPAGEVVFVANAKGAASHSGAAPYSVLARSGSLGRFGPADLVGPEQIAALNDVFEPSPSPRRARARPPRLAGPDIRHVFLIIKENRTYDQVLGDLPGANGDPGLAIYGRAVTPNHHALASQFVILDNFYASGAVSADGHQWLTQAMATDYIERSYSAGWPRSYPFSGGDPLAYAPTGFIWDNALRHGLSVRLFGEFTFPAVAYSRTWEEYLQDARSPQMRYSAPSRSTLASTAGIVERDFPSFALNVPDQFRARIFLDKFQQYLDRGDMPSLSLIWLPGDHTVGTSPDLPSPESMVADNDLAVGHIVEAISLSPVWPHSAIFVTEDDAQNGVDHVDGHRTICLIASPYVRRGVVDSTSYNHTSILRTVEDLLGLPPMNKFDAAALPMRSVFTATPEFSPYRASTNLVPLAVMNAALRDLNGQPKKDAVASLKMNFSAPDAAPEKLLNQVLWRSAKGSTTKYPRIPHRPACQAGDDDDRPGQDR